MELANATNAGYPARMPNPNRALAKGKPFYLILVDFLAMMCQETAQNRGTSIGMHT